MRYTHQIPKNATSDSIKLTSLSKGSGASGPPSLANHSAITKKVMIETQHVNPKKNTFNLRISNSFKVASTRDAIF